MKEQMQNIAFQMIAGIGEARSKYVEAVQKAKKGNFTEATELMAEGSKLHGEASHLHLDLIQKEAQGEDLPFSLIFVHAEDQMLANESFKFIAEELIEIYEEKNANNR